MLRPLTVASCAEEPIRDLELGKIVAAARNGDRQAFERLYSRYARLVHGVLISRVPVADVDDLMQDVFVHAMEKLPTLRDPSAFGAWLAAIARNRAIDHVRRRVHTVELRDDAIATHAGGNDAFEVLAIIGTLPDAYRETLVLRLVEGLTGPEIAACTGLTPGSVRVNLSRGMKQLRDRLAGGKSS